MESIHGDQMCGVMYVNWTSTEKLGSIPSLSCATLESHFSWRGASVFSSVKHLDEEITKDPLNSVIL